MPAKYDYIGINYDDTRKADPHILDHIEALLKPTANGTYLDIGCGTGNYTKALADRGYQMIGMDPSEEMLSAARKKDADIRWVKAHAEKTGLENEQVDGIIAQLTIHHWTDLQLSFQELYRVCKQGGRIVIFTTTPEQTANYWLSHYFPIIMERSVKVLPEYDKVLSALKTTGFTIDNEEKYFVKQDLKDGFLYCGKHDPEKYFDPEVRKGISSFSEHSNKKEVDAGLELLKSDIETGTIDQVMEQYKNDLGDYLFISAQMGPSPH